MSRKKMRSIANITEQRFVNLAQLFDIPIKKGWKKVLAKKIRLSETAIPNWINRNNIPEKRLAGIEKESFSKDKWYIVPLFDSEQNEQIGAPHVNAQLSTGAMPYASLGLQPIRGAPNIDRPDSAYLEDVKEVLKSKEKGIITALKANIVQFREMVHDRQEREKDQERLKKMERQINTLTKQLSLEKNAGDSLNNPADNAGNE